jgi:hypothetical protein
MATLYKRRKGQGLKLIVNHLGSDPTQGEEESATDSSDNGPTAQVLVAVDP